MRSFFLWPILAGLLSACAGPVADRAFDDIATRTAETIDVKPAWIKSDQDEALVRETLATLLGKPLSADDAVQVALLNNRRLQSNFAELGLGAADLTSAWRPANPGLSFGRFRRGQEIEIERAIGFDALNLLALPILAGIEERRFEQTKLRLAADILSLAAQTKRAWYEAVAAEQTAIYVTQIREAADIQADLARRMRAAGNNSLLDLTREQLFRAEATARLARSRLAATAAREKLGRLMGLAGRDMAFALPQRLPVLPAKEREAENIEAAAMVRRLDIQMAQAEVAAMRKNQTLSRATRLVNVLELGFARNSESAKQDQTGYEISLEIPIFDLGDAKATKAEMLYMRSVHHLAETAIQAQSAAREAWLGYRTAFELAQQYQTQIVPLRQKISGEMLLRYNGMLVSVFDLLTDAREQIAAVSEALEAQRDFWIADTNLTFVTLAPARDL